MGIRVEPSVQTLDHRNNCIDYTLPGRVWGVVEELFEIAYFRVVSVIMVGALVHSLPLFFAVGVGYAIYDWRRLALEASIVYHALRYPLPDLSTYERDEEGSLTFYQNTGYSPLFDPMGGKCFLDPVVSSNGATIFVGALPMHQQGEWLARNGVRHVVSMVEETEYLVPKLLGDVVRPEQWAAKGIQFHHFPTEDFAFPAMEPLLGACQAVQEAFERGQSVYIHCNAGRGRAPSVAALYLHRLTGGSLEEVEGKIVQSRPQVRLDRRKLRESILQGEGSL